MLEYKQTYDVAIIGGGLAGLSAAIQLAKKNYSVILFEKETYPFHKVCGEYISMESWSFLQQELEAPLSDWHLPIIDKLCLTAPNGKAFTTHLPLGGFGISRFKIDCVLAEIAKQKGVILFDETKVEQVDFNSYEFTVSYSSRKFLTGGFIKAKVCLGAFGKRSNLDVKWKRSFVNAHKSSESNYVGIKYHVKTLWPDELIGLHNFSDGYCGISKIEDEKYCLCYLTTASNLKRANHSITQMEKEVLFKNSALKKIFLDSEFLPGFPITISQISFRKKTLIDNHVLLAGDAAGMITPLCGNGMSMALHASKLAVGVIDAFLKDEIDRQQMEIKYQEQWKFEFSRRLQAGRLLQRFFGSDRLSNAFVSLFKTFPFLAQPAIRSTHGRVF